MVEVVDSEKLGVSYQKVEEIFEDKNAKVFYTILLNETIVIAKNKSKILKDQGSDTHGVFKSIFYFSLLTRPPISLNFLSGVWIIIL